MNDIEPLMQEYLQGLTSPFDSFLEEHIVSSAFYRIDDASKLIGYYAVHKDERLTQFYIRHAYLKHAQGLFKQVLDDHAVQAIFVPTCDELLSSLSLDQAEWSWDRQAYFFQDSGVMLPELGLLAEGEAFRPATMDDLRQIVQVCGDFLDAYERRIGSGEIFTYYRGSVLLGIGIAEESRLFEGLASIGMYAHEAYRQQGIGSTIIMQLRQWCTQHGIAPISGCWYYNEASKRTLEKAGMVTKTRLLNYKRSIDA
jgi:GNAT superfamily N-acetyltransferase